MHESAQESPDERIYLERFERYVSDLGLDVTIIDTGEHTQTVSQAAQALNTTTDQILKTLLFIDKAGDSVIAIAAGLSRIDAKRLASQQSMSKAKLAKPEVVLQTLGYPAGGVPPISLPADIPVVIDAAAARLETCYAGAGTTRHLARFRMADIQRLTNATIEQITIADS